MENGEFKGSTKARLNNIEHQLDDVHSDVKDVKKRINDLNRKVSYIYGFAGGLGMLAGLVSSWIIDKIN